MEISELKPDLKKISFAINANYYSDESHYDLLESNWERIEGGEVSYDIKDNAYLKLLIKEYSLETSYNDLLFIAHRCKKIQLSRRTREYTNLLYERNKELLYALKFLLDNEMNDLKIVIKHKKLKQSTSINNQILIQEFKDALLDNLKRKGIRFKKSYGSKRPPKEITDWGKYVNLVIDEKQAIGLQKGRKGELFDPGRYIDILQVYLQEFTEMKAEKGIPISRRQASFIYKFLNQFDFFPHEFAWKEDSIRHLLVKTRESKGEDSFDPT